MENNERREPTAEELQSIDEGIQLALKSFWFAAAKIGEKLESEGRDEGMTGPVLTSALLMIAADILVQQQQPVETGVLLLKNAYERALDDELFTDEDDETPSIQFMDAPTTLQ